MPVPTPDPPLLELDDVSVRYATPAGEVIAVQSASLSLRRGQILGIAGESGSGKTQLLLALLGLTARGARITGSARLGGAPLLGLPDAQLQKLRGNRLAMVFQDPMTALNPQLRIGLQLTEVLRWHRGLSRTEATARARAMLEAVGLTEPQRRLSQYPHELSGGMRQRVMIAMALLCEPDVLLADEPTTALDVTVQAQILDLLLALREQLQMAIILVTHDFGVIARIADEVMVMRGGVIIERGEAAALLSTPQEPYTRQLLEAARRLEIPAESLT